MPLWAAQYAGSLPGANVLWHAHEMLFGYAFSVIAGFLLTASRAWTGRPTPSGGALAAICAVWIGARVTGFFSLPAATALDAVFAMAVAVGIGRPILASRNRNWYFIVFVLALGAASAAFNLWPRVSLTLGLDVVLFVIALMGGRVIPSFTNNALRGAGARRITAVEYGALGSLLLLILVDLAQWERGVPFVCLAAAVLHAVRLALWAPLATRSRPILWILHASYAWVVVHLLLRGLEVPTLATHALTVGAIGGLTLGMMTRTARGHTARPLEAGQAEVSAYVLVQLAAVVRVFVPLAAPSAYVASVVLSAALWSVAFAVFTVRYYPILSRPRLDGQPG